MVASLVIEQTVPLPAMSLSPRAGNGNNGQPLFALHESKPTPRLGLHLRDCVAAVPTFGVFFNNPLSQSFEGCRPFPPSETGGSSDYPFTAPAVMPRDDPPRGKECEDQRRNDDREHASAIARMRLIRRVARGCASCPFFCSVFLSRGRRARRAARRRRSGS